MSTEESVTAPTTSPAHDEPSSPSVELVSGHLADHEIAAIAVAVAAMSAVSREEAHQREIAERAGHSTSAWNSPVATHRSAYPLRASAGPKSWMFSQR
ncbi:Uncharacterised protein [Mycobacteroides abscessus subsp. abscessus]|uniref:acyl-CoA carboxylase epsilon subunit n=1 Tax=Dermabacter vaginalis TaxID=1630135 RepID=UPI000925E30D|nr:acyl-CoA carboxylase epsilon subunit [Dermabacter vaginalis]MCG7443029.1 hypothetical protein [Dermabacter vaginalis]SHX49610.1 Uncharacterised protein [Mycobacteroides abscessus subsp. abscessus]